MLVEQQYTSCPCTYLKEPCQPRCTCVNPLSSQGCLFCCTYGSIEQRTAMANHLAEKLRPIEVSPIIAQIEICGGKLELLGGDGEDGEGMPNPLHMRCKKCGEEEYYTETSALKGCNHMKF